MSIDFNTNEFSGEIKRQLELNEKAIESSNDRISRISKFSDKTRQVDSNTTSQATSAYLREQNQTIRKVNDGINIVDKATTVFDELISAFKNAIDDPESDTAVKVNQVNDKINQIVNDYKFQGKDVFNILQEDGVSSLNDKGNYDISKADFFNGKMPAEFFGFENSQNTDELNTKLEDALKKLEADKQSMSLTGAKLSASLENIFSNANEIPFKALSIDDFPQVRNALDVTKRTLLDNKDTVSQAQANVKNDSYLALYRA